MTADGARAIADSLWGIGAGERAGATLGDGPACPHDLVPLVAAVDHHRRRGVDFTLRAPDGTEMSRAIMGLASGRLAPDIENPPVDPFGRVWRFSSYDEQNALVNAMLLRLGKSALLGKGVKEAFIWCLNEVMDNVLTHSARDGHPFGYVMVRFDDAAKRLKVCVFDLGIGLKASFEGSKYSPADDYGAISLALKANVTSGIGQGNGLWGLHELIRRAEDGSVSLASGEAAYLFAPREGIDGRVDHRPLAGFAGTTLVDFRMKVSGEIKFDQVFPGVAQPVDLWQETHETDGGRVRYGVLEVAGGSGTRPSAAALRHIAENTIDNDGKAVVLDFDGVTFCSSAFIDELVGKLILRYGFLGFTQKVSLVNVHGLSAQLVDHSIMQRLAELGHGAGPQAGARGRPEVDTPMNEDIGREGGVQ
jgi:hypothetical protein